jgi:hypothetical protein
MEGTLKGSWQWPDLTAMNTLPWIFIWIANFSTLAVLNIISMQYVVKPHGVLAGNGNNFRIWSTKLLSCSGIFAWWQKCHSMHKVCVKNRKIEKECIVLCLLYWWLFSHRPQGCAYPDQWSFLPYDYKGCLLTPHLTFQWENLLSNQPALWSRVLLQKLVGHQQFNKYPTMQGTKQFITVFKQPATCPYPQPN